MNTPRLLPSTIRGCLAGAITTLALFTATPAQAGAPKTLRLTADAGNTDGSALTINHPLLNGKPKLNPIVTQFWTSVYNNHVVGLEYDYVAKKWVIRNEDFAAMPVGAKFNILIPSVSKRISASPAVTEYNYTTFQLQKGNPNALLHASHMINPFAGVDGNYSNKNLGVFFTGGSTGPIDTRWAVYNEDETDMPVASYNIADVTKLKIGGVANSFIFTTTGANISANTAQIDNALTDGKPDAMVFITHRYGQGSNTYMDQPVGVYYFGGKWRLFLESNSGSFPTNRAFVVSVFPAATP